MPRRHFPFYIVLVLSHKMMYPADGYGFYYVETDPEDGMWSDECPLFSDSGRAQSGLPKNGPFTTEAACRRAAVHSLKS